MKIDQDALRRQYARLSDDALREIDPAELVPEARACFEAEWKARGLDQEPSFEDEEEPEIGEPEPEPVEEEERVAVTLYHSTAENSSEAVDAVAILTDAGIPAEVESKFMPASEEPAPRDYWVHSVMVPTAHALEAESILECEMHNQEIEQKWRGHFAALGDRELRRFDVDSLFAGLLDRIERVKRAYAEELKRRS